MTYPHWIVAALKTLANVVVYVASGRRLLLFEGRWWRGRYRNWSGDRSHRGSFERPASEKRLADIVANAERVRVVGSGHSFNDGLQSDAVTLSLDRLTGVVGVDRATKRVTAWAGTRLRDLNRELRAHGLAVACLASHDAQSLAGILSTDVHGTAKVGGHLSDAVTSLRLVDGTGTCREVDSSDEVFRAAVGGAGSIGVITQVTIQCVDEFRLRQASVVETRAWAEGRLGRLLHEHDHVSFYAYPFTELVHVHTWDRTDAPLAVAGPARELANHAKAALAAAFVGDLAAHAKLLPRTADPLMRLQAATNLVLCSDDAFNRTLYPLHQELEFAVPAADVWTRLTQVLSLFEELYDTRDLPFLLVEIRFTPGGHETSLLGAGSGRSTAWLCLCCNQSGDVGAYFDAVEDLLASTDARPHLGKWNERGTAADLGRLYGERYELFTKVRRRSDPEGRFTNPFIDRVLGPSRDPE